MLVNRQIRECFSLTIACTDPLLDLERAIKASMIIDMATQAMLRGQISPEDLLEVVEPYLTDIDEYIDQVDENLTEIYLGD